MQLHFECMWLHRTDGLFKNVALHDDKTSKTFLLQLFSIFNNNQVIARPSYTLYNIMEETFPRWRSAGHNPKSQ